MTLWELRNKLIAQADRLALMAESAETVAKHFRPRFEKCWHEGKLVLGEEALRLRPYVLDNEREMKALREEEGQIRAAANALRTDEGGE